MTRIALIAGTYQPDRCGVAHYTARLREALSERGVVSIVLTTHDAAKATNDSTVQGVVDGWTLTNLLPLVRAIHAAQVDILHIQHAAGTYGFDRSIFLLPLLLRATGWRSPIVTTIHEYGWWEWQPRLIPSQLLEWLKTWGQQRGWWDREDGFLLTQSDVIVTTNDTAEQAILSRLPQFEPRVHRIPIGANVEVAQIDRTVARQKLRQMYGWMEDTAIVAFFGFLHPVKGLETLLPAFKHILAVQPQARLLLIGGVESLALPGEQATRYWNQLQALIAELDLKETVQMTGYLDADTASHYLGGCDIGVLPFNHGVTLKSGSLLTLLAHGLPVVATRSHPPDLHLEEKPLVRAIAPRNSSELAMELIQLLTNLALQEQLKSAGCHFSRQFAWTSIAEAHLEIYRTLSARNSEAFSFERI